jgi:flagellar biosynthesis GTPase FlhF
MQFSVPVAPRWLARAFHEIQRGHHLVISGNIDDLVCWDAEYMPLRQALEQFLRVTGFRATAHYDLVDGLTFTDDESRRLMTPYLAPATEQPRQGDADNHQDPVTAPRAAQPRAASEPGRRPAQARLSDAALELQRRMAAASQAEIRRPADLAAAAHRLMTQSQAACAVIIDAAELIFGMNMPVGEDYQLIMMYLNKLLDDAVQAPAQDGRLRNTMVLVARQLSSLPQWVYQHNPRVAPITVEHPGLQERGALIMRELRSFHGGESLPPGEADQLVGLLANLTEGMTILDIYALAVTSRTTKIPPSSARRLVMRHRFGLQDDPWEQLDPRKVRDAEQILSARVMGQSAAVRTVASMLIGAKIGIDFTDSSGTSSRPKGVFFFVGPTGVGKTELAKAIAELVFDDESALRRFDMSEFGQEHTSERLTGAPPGYIGHESGGVLTNWVIERPFSVILFDEIEKAHPKIFDKFLQIIDDGRLTDGHGRTAFFSHSIVIFTSNLGAATLRDETAGFPPGSPPQYSMIKEHFETQVTDYLAGRLGRPELIGRLGSAIVTFDILREPVIRQIVGKFLDQLAAAAEVRGYRVIFDRSAIEQAVVEYVMREGARYGARQIRSPLLEEWVRIPLNRWVMEQAPDPATRIWVHRSAQSPPLIVDLFPAPSG